MKELFISFSIVSFLIFPAYATEPEDDQLLDEIDKQEIHVMPFGLEKTIP
ncbi:hypothetical protein [Nitrosomonas aestuarii]|nr:hypothetical protein [Nitrosomonas aestuarii]